MRVVPELSTLRQHHRHCIKIMGMRRWNIDTNGSVVLGIGQFFSLALYVRVGVPLIKNNVVSHSNYLRRYAFFTYDDEHFTEINDLRLIVNNVVFLM